MTATWPWERKSEHIFFCLRPSNSFLTPFGNTGISLTSSSLQPSCLLGTLFLLGSYVQPAFSSQEGHLQASCSLNIPPAGRPFLTLHLKQPYPLLDIWCYMIIWFIGRFYLCIYSFYYIFNILFIYLYSAFGLNTHEIFHWRQVILQLCE